MELSTCRNVYDVIPVNLLSWFANALASWAAQHTHTTVSLDTDNHFRGMRLDNTYG